MQGTFTAFGVHGDFHVGQVLRDSDGRLLVTDFDGNPALLAEQRLAPQPAARDVAGMLASIDHVARVVVHRTPGVDADRVLSWIAPAQDAFLSSYREHAGHLLDDSLLRPMMAEQECREFVYAATRLPHWRYVPAAALPALMEA
jgi:maltokinase